MQKPTIVWFRQDLRVSDHPALIAALQRGGPVIPLFIFSPEEEGLWPPGAASRYWLHHSLQNLQSRLAKLGCQLILRSGPSLHALQKLIQQTGSDAVCWHRRYEPAIVRRDAKIAQSLRGSGIQVEIFNSSLLHEPESIRQRNGQPYQVFTPFWRTCLSSGEPSRPLPAPKSIPRFEKKLDSVSLAAFELEPKIDWTSGIRQTWKPGEAGAWKVLEDFLSDPVADYAQARDIPGVRGTSRLSPHLHFGEISPRQIWHAVRQHELQAGRRGDLRSSEIFLKEIGWREFAYHLLVHFPKTPERPLRSKFEKFPWEKNVKHLRAWQRGQTGYPLVDAGMRELWATGWMHNRVRMIVASFLVKDLLVDWRQGAKWFWDTLVDADLANNTLGWQWAAGCGADAAPFFRIFNPVTQSEKFDAEGDYIRAWVPELRRIHTRWIHRPWTAPAEQRGDYPLPIVDHAQMRRRALAAFRKLK